MCGGPARCRAVSFSFFCNLGARSLPGQQLKNLINLARRLPAQNRFPGRGGFIQARDAG